VSVFWDFLRYGLPTVGAVSAGLWANRKGMKSVSTAGVAAAGWGVGWLAQYLAGKAVDVISSESLPEDIASPIGLLPELAGPTADQAIATVQGNADTVEHPYQPTRRDVDGQPKQATLTMLPGGAATSPQVKKPFDPSALGGGEGSN
jgi:hypothetical protein